LTFRSSHDVHINAALHFDIFRFDLTVVPLSRASLLRMRLNESARRSMHAS